MRIIPAKVSWVYAAVIVGGAFAGLEHIIEQRVGKKSLGFTDEVRGEEEREAEGGTQGGSSALSLCLGLKGKGRAAQ